MPQGRKNRSIFSAPPLRACVEIKIYGAFVLNHRVDLRAIDSVAVSVPHRSCARLTA